MSEPQTAPIAEVEDGGRDAPDSSLDATRYDFGRHDRIPKDHIRSLQFLYDRFARNLRTSLSAYLRVSTEVGLESVEQMAYADFVTGSPESTAFYAVGVEPVSGRAGLEVSPTAAYAMIDRMLGGRGESIAVNRALTDIEQRVVDNVVNLILEQMTEEWRGIGKVTFTIKRREARAEMLQIAAPNDAVVTLRLSVKLGECDGALNLCLPAEVLEELGSGFDDRWRSRGYEESVNVDRRPLYENLSRVELPTDVVLETPLRTSDLLQLSEGDVLSLGVPDHAPVDVRVCGRRKFKGTLTQADGGVSVAVHTVTVPVKA